MFESGNSLLLDVIDSVMQIWGFELAVIGRKFFFRQFDDDGVARTVGGRFLTCNPTFASMIIGNFETNPVFSRSTHGFGFCVLVFIFFLVDDNKFNLSYLRHLLSHDFWVSSFVKILICWGA
ncbi:hypothetical protein HanRHA438_Chr09g0381901 [Helianthus annuus]|nr:hypothetical protein HanRHA438_Chr09g0381901 [Helianthus annuus]